MTLDLDMLMPITTICNSYSTKRLFVGEELRKSIQITKFFFVKLTLIADLRSLVSGRPGLVSGSIPGLSAYSPLDFLRLPRMRPSSGAAGGETRRPPRTFERQLSLGLLC